MKSVFVYIVTALWALLLLCASCTEQELISGGQPLPPGQYRFTVTIPEPQAATRALGDRAENVTDEAAMPMRVLVFDENGFFVAFQEAKVESFDEEGQKGTYTVSLPRSEGEKRILHFVLGKVDYDTYVPTDSEADIFGHLTVSNGTDVYWQRMELGDGITDGTQLPTVSLVRNFAKISVVNEAESNGFQLTGFAVVYATTAGTVAPYTGAGTNGGFADYAGLTVPAGTDAYEAFTTHNPGFGGNMAGEVDRNLPADDSEFTPAAKYVYERNQDDTSTPACILLLGTYGDKRCYYKLDIVRTDQQTWITSYLNLYRNFHYIIRINNVYSEGYASPEEAMRAAAANNIGASVEVSEVNTIQDGKDQLWVSTLDTLLVTADVAEIYYTFHENIADDGGTLANDRVVITPVYDGQQVLNPAAVASYDTSEPGVLKITPAALPAWMEEQEFVVAVRESGLSRRIRVRVRQPFQFMAVDCEEQIPAGVDSTLHLIVRLPENMPTAVFPLVLDIEPRRKTIYPDAEENRLPVSTDKDYSYSYQATVTWEDYRNNYTQYYTFLTNVSQSQTYVTVTNPYFVNNSEEENFGYPTLPATVDVPRNVAKFENGEYIYDFFNVSLSSPGNGSFEGTPNQTNKGTFTFNDYDPYGKDMTLTFYMHEEDDGFAFNADAPHEPVEIYIDYGLSSSYQSTTGTIEEDPEHHRILYTPHNTAENLVGEQSITFTIDTHYATEAIQLSSFDHESAWVTYEPKECVVTFQYGSGRRWNNVPRNSTITIYGSANDRRYERNAIGQCTVGNNGQATVILSERDPGMTLYFRYTADGWLFDTDYDGESTVSQLPGSTVWLEEN